MIREAFWLFIFVPGAFHLSGEEITNQPLFRLMNDLFVKSNYSSEIPPISRITPKIHLHFDLRYKQLISLNEKEQILTSKLWITMRWNTIYLKWNPNDYAEDNAPLYAFLVRKSRIWVPRIVVYNSASNEVGEQHLYHLMTTDATLLFNGVADLLSPVTIKTQCEINVKYFPFDSQTCKLTFGSWNLDSNLLNISLIRDEKDQSAATEYFIKNGEWDLSVSVTRDVVHYECCKTPFIHLTYNVNLKRRSSYYVIFIIVPYSIIALLTLVSFLFPPDSGDRVSIVITVLLAMTFYMMVIAEKMPPSSHVVPLVAVFLVQLIVQIALALVATAILLNCYQKTTPVPRYIKLIVVEWLSKILCVSKQPLDSSPDMIAASNGFVKGGEHTRPRTTSERAESQYTSHAAKGEFSDTGDKNINAGFKETANTLAHPLVQAFLEYDNKSHYKEDWQFVTLVLNRAFAVFFMLATLVSTLTIFLQVPLSSEN